MFSKSRHQREKTTYRIKVENPLAISHGVAIVELDGRLLDDDLITLTDDGQVHTVRVVLGEKPAKETADDANETSQQEPIR